MIEQKVLLNRMAAEWIKEFMYQQKPFKVNDIAAAMPLKHLGIDWSKPQLCDPQREYIYDLIAKLIPVYAGRFGYAKDKEGIWRQANLKPQPEFELADSGCLCKCTNSSFSINPDENYDDCNGVLPEEDDDDDDLTTDMDDLEREGVAITPPFENYCKELRALFGADPEVTIVEDKKNKTINFCVAGCDKPEAYRVYFPGKMTVKGIGEITILVNGHAKSWKTKADAGIIQRMFYNHPYVDAVKITKFPDGDWDRLFLIFKDVTIQYKNDNFGSLWNMTTTTPEALSKKIMPKASETGVVVWKTTRAGEYDESAFVK